MVDCTPVSVDNVREDLSSKDADERIKVCVRVRPLQGDIKDNQYAWAWEDNTIYPQQMSQIPYSYDRVFSPDNSNKDIFDSVVKDVVLQSLNGYNGCIFTYGQTSSGKTFTMNGNPSQPGIIPLSILYCFQAMEEKFPDRKFNFRVSYVEVYNEQVKDLLSLESARIRIQHDPKQGIRLTGVKEPKVLNAEEAIAFLKVGEINRHISATGMNDTSSRAHTLFRLIVESEVGDDAGTSVRISHLNLVDLAGSENAKMTNSVGDRAIEAKFINKSLLALSLIMQKLSDEKPGTRRKQYLPYRDSKLTRLLQTSLSGNANIAVICTVSPNQRCFDETNDTLKFAARAKKINTNATIFERQLKSLIDDRDGDGPYFTEDEGAADSDTDSEGQVNEVSSLSYSSNL